MSSALGRITRGSPLSPSGLRQLLSPRWKSARNLLIRGERRGMYLGFLCFGLLFWLGMLAGMHFLVDYMWSIQELGSFIPRKLIDLLLVSLFSMLCFSNVIAALSTFFLSDDLELVLALPVSRPTFHFARFLDTYGQSSWMLILFGLPVFFAFGMVIGGGWDYYLSLMLGLPAMLSIATNFGIIVATVMVNVYPARRTRELMMVIAMILVAFLFVLMRALHPEQLVDPEKFQNAAAWVAAVNVPAPPMLPSRWVSEILQATLFHMRFPWMESAMLATGAVAMFGLARWTTAWGFDAGWARSQEARAARFYRAPFFDVVTRVLPKEWRAVAAKELRVFSRDPAQWSQIFLLAGLCAVYLVSMSALPVDAFHGKVAMMVRDAIAVLNLGMGGFLMSAIATRFQFTAVGREGHAWWILRGAPVRPVSVLYAKAAVGLVPMVTVGEIVVVGSARMLGLGWGPTLVEGALAFLFALSLSGLAMAMGAWWPEFRAENAARAAQTPGAVFFMVLAQLLIFVSMVLYAIGGWGLMYTSAHAQWLGWVPIGLGVLLNLACAFGLPRRAAEDLWARGI